MNCRRQALKLCLDATVIVIVEIVNQFSLKVFHGCKFLQIEQLALEQAEEVFDHGTVQTVSFPAHALPDAFLLGHPLVLLALVLPALIGMQNQIDSVWYLLKSFIQHGRNQAQNRPAGDCIADQITAMQIQNGRKIQLLPEQAKFRYIRNPLLVWLFGMEVPVQQIWRDLADLTLEERYFFILTRQIRPICFISRWTVL